MRQFLTDIRVTDALIALFTGLLVWSTILLYQATKKAAEAAKQSADATSTIARVGVEAERAHLFVEILQEGIIQPVTDASMYFTEAAQADARLPTLRVSFRAKNFGRTPAVVTEVSYQMILAAELPKELEYELRLDEKAIDQILVSNDSTEAMNCRTDTVLTVADARLVAEGNSSIWFYGYLKYLDVFDHKIHRRFMWRYSGDGLRMVYQSETIGPVKTA